MTADFIIAGAGPAGCAAALEAVKLGYKKIIVIEKQSLPRLKPCAGGISMRADNLLKEYNFYPELKNLMQPIESASLTLPNSKEFEIKGEATASVINRGTFDNFLQEQVKAAGIEILSGTKVKEIFHTAKDTTIIEATTSGKQLEREAKAVINCTGANNRLHQETGKKTRIVGCTAWFEGQFFDPKKMELIFDRELLPHYGWLFPESENSCNIGICLYLKKLKSKTIIEVYNDFIQKYYTERLKNAETIVSPKVHPIIPARSIKSCGLKGTLLAGDAARLINAFTGEGISYALLSGRTAVHSWHRGLRYDWSWEQINRDYEAALKQEISSSLKKGFTLVRTAKPLLAAAGILAGNKFVRTQVTKKLSKI